MKVKNSPLPSTKTTDNAQENALTPEMLLVAAKTKAVLKSHGLNVSSEALASLNKVVHWYVNQAARRTLANGRKTVMNHDFCI